MITLRLTPDDARFLHRQLVHRARHLEAELVRTDKHELQHALAVDLDRLLILMRDLEQEGTEGDEAASEQRPGSDS